MSRFQVDNDGIPFHVCDGFLHTGVVAGLGPSCESDFQESEKVMALMLGGGYAEYAVVDERTVIRALPNVEMLTLASIPEAFMTAYQLSYFVAKLQPGESLLLHAAASSVGQAAIQMAVRKGITVFATARSDEKCARCVELGAKAAVKVGDDGLFADAIRAANGGKGIDVILDPVGATYIGEDLAVAAVDGRVVLYGLMAGGGVQDPSFLVRVLWGPILCISHFSHLVGTTDSILHGKNTLGIMLFTGKDFVQAHQPFIVDASRSLCGVQGESDQCTGTRPRRVSRHRLRGHQSGRVRNLPPRSSERSTRLHGTKSEYWEDCDGCSIRCLKVKH